MIVSLTIVRYHKAFIPLALLAMALHRLPMRMQKGCTFWKLLGSNRNGAFDLQPDWQQWGLLAVWESRNDFNNFADKSFISSWWYKFTKEQWTVLSTPLQSHGKWSGREPFGNPKITEYTGPIAVLTRAKIKFSRLKSVWSSVYEVSDALFKAPGRIMSINIGETYSLAATFSIWENAEEMKAFAYTKGKHADVIKKAHNENWLSEELFARFKPVASFGSINGKDPLAGIDI